MQIFKLWEDDFWLIGSKQYKKPIMLFGCMRRFDIQRFLHQGIKVRTGEVFGVIKI